MTYNNGNLEVYVAETRSPERRSRKKDRVEEGREERGAIQDDQADESSESDHQDVAEDVDDELNED
jgi:hypothetical protein